MIQPTNLRLLLLLILSMGLASCSSSQKEPSPNPSTISLQTFNDDINAAMRQINAVEAGLDKLTDPGQPDLKRAFKEYSNAVSNMIATEEQFSLHAERMKGNGIYYFKTWEKQENEEYKDPHIRNLTIQRRDTVQKIYEDITVSGIGLETDLKDFVSDIKLIQSSLSTDLSKESIRGIENISQKVILGGDDLENAMLDMQKIIQKAQTEMLSVETPEPVNNG